MESPVGILAIAEKLPARSTSVQDLYTEEEIEMTADRARQIGIDSVHCCTDETGSVLALAAVEEVVETTGIDPLKINIIVDYGIMPQEYLVPAWNMSNKIQHDIGATKSFTIGFSGTGSTNIIVALDFAMATLRSDTNVNYILLLGADCALPKNRVINPGNQHTVLGDGASALLVGRDSGLCMLESSHISTHGSYHDLFHIKGGGMLHPDREDLYRLSIDEQKYEIVPKYDFLSVDVQHALSKSALSPDEIDQVIYPNFSAADRAGFVGASSFSQKQMHFSALPTRGFVHSNDLVFNLKGLLETAAPVTSDALLMCSHGLGYTSGAITLRR